MWGGRLLRDRAGEIHRGRSHDAFSEYASDSVLLTPFSQRPRAGVGVALLSVSPLLLPEDAVR